jgi:hypothetical protein
MHIQIRDFSNEIEITGNEIEMLKMKIKMKTLH